MNEFVGAIPLLVDASDRIALVGNWITSVQDALHSTAVEEAIWKPAHAERSIFEIVLHMTVWTDWAANFLRGHDTETVDWPLVTREDEDAWQDALNDLNRALLAFRTSIGALSPPDLLYAPVPEVTKTTNLAALLSILVHNAYHVGQITKLRERWLAEEG